MEDDDFDAELAAELALEQADSLRKAEPPPVLARGDFLAWRSPRLVGGNPTPLDHPLWHWLVRTRWSAYDANKAFDGPSPFEAGPMWCFERFGMSETALPDGRVVCIGGEHEDFYDPDFYIYNDVVIVDPKGRISIHGYPRELFPPTDFHTATPVGNAMVMIGGLGYPTQRVMGVTPVFQLDLGSMAIERIDTSGEAPGWIHGHRATVSEDGRHIVVRGGETWRNNHLTLYENIDTWSLDLARRHWTRLTVVDWQRWTMVRVDRGPSRLYDLRQASWHRDHAWAGSERRWAHAEAPDFDALAVLYRIDAQAPVPEAGAQHHDFRTVVDGVVVRFAEQRHAVHAIVEGRLSAERLQALQRQTLATLERIDASPWEIDGVLP